MRTVGLLLFFQKTKTGVEIKIGEQIPWMDFAWIGRPVRDAAVEAFGCKRSHHHRIWCSVQRRRTVRHLILWQSLHFPLYPDFHSPKPDSIPGREKLPLNQEVALPVASIRVLYLSERYVGSKHPQKTMSLRQPPSN